jgi:two-component system chemotaxis response regulator CheB
MSIVIADDSPIARAFLREILSLHSAFKVVGEASNVVELKVLVERHRPQFVTLDLLMPGKPGLVIIRELSEKAAVVVVSDSNEDSPLARESLAQGAYAFVSKRTLGSPAGRATLTSLLLNGPTQARTPLVVAVVGSTGAMPALEGFVAELGQLNASTVIVQHLPALRMPAFADWLGTLGLPSQVVERSRTLTDGKALVAPGDRHLRVSRGERAELDDSPPVAGHRPSGDILFKSLVSHAPYTVAVVLSGMGRDGAGSLTELCAGGAACIVQKPETCAVPSMPEAALRASGGTAWSLSPKEIGAALRSLLGTMRHA